MQCRKRTTAARCLTPARALLATATLVVVSTVVFSVSGADPAAAHTPHDNIHDVALSPRFDDDGTVYAISRLYLLKSTDRGEHWHKLVNGIDSWQGITSVEVSRQDPQIVYAASPSNGVYKSTDAGRSWHGTSPAGTGARNVTVLALSPHSDDVVYAGGPHGLFATADGAASWRGVTGVDLEHVTAVAFSPDRDDVVVVGDHAGSIHLSGDSAATWRSVRVEAGKSGGVTALALSPNRGGGDTLFVGTASQGIVKSVDGGKTFAESDAGITDDRIASLLVSANLASDTALFATTWKDGVFASDDGGQHWSRRSRGLITDEQADLIDVSHWGHIASTDSPAAASTMFVAGFKGLFRTDDDGNKWQEVQTQSSSNLTGLAVSPNYAEDSTIAATTYINGAFRSDDSGVSWKAISRGLALRNEWRFRSDYIARLVGVSFSPTFASDRTLFSGTRGFVFRSTNRGNTWDAIVPRGVLVEGEFPPDYFLQVFSPAYARDKTIVLGTEAGKVFRSTNGGTSFSKVGRVGVDENGFLALAISPEFPEDDRLFGVTATGAVTSTDRGDTWTPLAALPSYPASIAVSPDYGADHSVWVGTSTGMFVTRDDGQTWSPLAQPGTDIAGTVEGFALSSDFGHDGTMLVSIRGRGLFKSTDHGTTFRATGEDLISNNVAFANFYHYTSAPIVFSPDYPNDHTVFGYAEERVYKSTNGGETWSVIEVPRARHSTAESAAERPLLVTPRYNAESSPVAANRSAPSNTFTRGRVVAATLAGLVALFAVLAVAFTRKRSASGFALGFTCAVAVFAGSLVALILLH